MQTTTRADIVAKIEAAREEGDLKENGGYHAAREEQGKLEARIRQLTQLLRDVRVGTTPSGDVVEEGCVVAVDYGDDDVERFLFANRENATDEGGKVTLPDGTTLDVYSPESPIGQAIAGSGPATASSSGRARSRSPSCPWSPTPAEPHGLSPGRPSSPRPAGPRPRPRCESGPRVSSCRATSTSSRCSPRPVRRCSTSSTLPPVSASTASSRASSPGRSGTRTRSDRKRPAASRPCRITLLQQQRVDVAARDDRDDGRREALRVVEQRGHRGRAGRLDDELGPLEAQQQRPRQQVLVDGDHPVDEVADEREGQVARTAHGDAVGHRRHARQRGGAARG